jgi:2-phospho-L-lactate guanylyltransferase
VLEQREPGVWAVVVARVANGAKSRLSTALDVEQRRDLALSMLADVLDVCAHAPILTGVVAVVDDPAARHEAEHAGAFVVEDSTPGDMNAAVNLGLRTAQSRGAQTALVLPGDIPLVTVDDLEALLAAAGHAPRAVVVGASRDGQGTNALLLRPLDVITPAFGPPSVERHLRAGRQAGALTRVVHHLGLALDVDTPADLAALAR